MSKISFLPNGQWELKKYDEESYGHIHGAHTAIPTGEHTVEVHPHIDHLMNIKGAIKESGKDRLKVQHLKKAGLSKQFLQDHVPKDGNGWITPEMIDEHIDNLPKHKVTIKVAPYRMKAQQHRDGEQHVISVHAHGDTNMDVDGHHNVLSSLQDHQHKFEGIDSDSQIGWARIDPKGHHWHIDEIQSDLNNPDKVYRNLERSYDDALDNRDSSEYDSEEWRQHEMEKDDVPYVSKEGLQQLHEKLSHGHDDPQHMIHSAVNQLARKYNVQSMSMDTSKDQATQSGLITSDANLKNAIDKVGGLKALEGVFRDPHYTSPELHNDAKEELLSEFGDKLNNQEAMALDGILSHHLMQLPGSEGLHGRFNKEGKEPDEYMDEYDELVEDHVQDSIGMIKDTLNESDKKLPVHQINTYDKRPKKLGMKPHDKNKVLGEDKSDSQTHVQYHKLHKTLLRLKEALKKC